jgi:hypothetical protein
LHPDYFVVPNQHITYYNRPGLTPPDGLAFVLDKELMTGDPPSCFPPFRHVSRRAPAEAVNIFFFILNAGAKFRNYEKYYGFGDITERAKELVDKTLQIVELIYFRPTVNGVEIGAVSAWNDEAQDTESDFSTEGEEEEGKDADAINMTSDEIDEVFRKLEDPSLSAMERFELSCCFMFPKGEL